MRLKIPSRYYLSIIIVIIICLIFFLIVKGQTIKNTNHDAIKNPVNISIARQIESGLPIRINIPQINVDSFVEHVGLTTLGAMDVPKDAKDVAWFDLGTRPGEIGSSVIDGHYGWKNNIPVVFDNLSKLKKGNKIYIKDDEGFTSTFIVQKIKIYSQNEETSDIFGSNDGKAHLNLITCDGVWNASKKAYSNRLVVFSDLE